MSSLVSALAVAGDVAVRDPRFIPEAELLMRSGCVLIVDHRVVDTDIGVFSSLLQL